MVKKWVRVFLLEVICFVIDGKGQTLNYTASPGFQTRNQHQDVTLSWQVSYTGGNYMFWEIYLYQENICLISMFAGMIHDCDGRRRGLLVVNDTYLDYTVQNTSSGDAGQYTCAIKKGPNLYNDSNAILYIFDSPDTPLLSPSEPSLEGDKFTIKCHAASTSLPAANRFQVNMVYTWHNNSEQLDPNDLPERYNIIVSGNPGNAVNDLLVITNLSRHDAGSYTCKAHEGGSVLQSPFSNSSDLEPLFASYNVQVNPSAEMIEYERLEPVQCTAVCNPPCSYSWYKGNTQVSSNAELMIHNVTRDYHGMYECRPDNGIPGGQTADFNLTVLYGPSVNTFEVVTPSLSINQTDDVTVSCQTDSRPAPVITLIRPSGDTLAPSSTSNTLKHTLTHIDCLDSGYYRCDAYNSRTERRDHELLQIAVQCPPRKHSTSDVKVGAAEGDTVTFSITAIAYPQPMFMWFFKGNVLPDQSYVAPTSYSQGFVPEVYVNSTLTLSNVTQGDFGNYSVTASNPLGDMEHVVYSLTPAGKPTAPSQLGASYANAVSITMQWIPGWNRGGEQVFTLMYRRPGSNERFTNITNISDPGQGEMVTAKARNLTSDSSYDFIVVADNQYGFTPSQLASAATTTQPDLGSENGDFSIVIFGNMATITWGLHGYSGPITHVDVNSCVSNSTNCILTTKDSPKTSSVEVAVPVGGSSYTFEFLVYDGDDLLLSVNHIAKVDGGSPVGIIVGVVVVVVLVVAAVIAFVIWRRKSQPDARKKITIGSELGHFNPVMVTDDDISLTANGKHDTISEGHQMVVENTLYASSGPGGDDHMDQPYSEVPVVTGNRVTGAKAPGKKNKPKGKKGARPVDSLLPENAEVDCSQKPKTAKKKTKKADIVEPEVVEYEEVDFKKKSPGAPAVAAGGGVAIGAAALPEYGQVDFSKKHKQGKAAKPPQLEEYAQVDFSKKNKKESGAAGKDKPPVKGKKPKPGAPPPRPPRAASVDEGERVQSPPDHQPQYGVERTLYADLDLINTRPTCTEPTIHANLEPTEYASIDALRLTTRPADQ